MKNQSFADYFKKLHKSMGVSQAELSRITGINEGTLWSWEYAKNDPTTNLEVLGKLIRFLGPRARFIFEEMGISLAELRALVKSLEPSNYENTRVRNDGEKTKVIHRARIRREAG